METFIICIIIFYGCLWEMQGNFFVVNIKLSKFHYNIVLHKNQVDKTAKIWYNKNNYVKGDFYGTI